MRYSIEGQELTDIADALRRKHGTDNTYQTNEMAQAIDDIAAGPPAEAFTVSGDCQYRFANGGWDWFIQQYGDKITTNNIVDASHMFDACKVEYIPFELNMSKNVYYVPLTYLFNECENLLQVPKITSCIPYSMNSMFYKCIRLRNIPEDFADEFDYSYMSSSSSSSLAYIFQYCYSIRSIPMRILQLSGSTGRNSVSYFYNGFNSCYSLDELTNLPIPYTATWTSSAFNSTFESCTRLKNITFATPDGQPYVKQWKSQTIDLISVGWGNKNNIINYNSGITADKEVKDDATYQALKDDPDWFATKVEYSRYNHDSAVATINSLPDTSAYIAANGGTNTIKFKGTMGSATDGGAINTLTAEEIAVATAKGWTVTLS